MDARSQKSPSLHFNKPVILAPAESDRDIIDKLDIVNFENAMKGSNNQTFNNDSPDESSQKAIKPIPIP